MKSKVTLIIIVVAIVLAATAGLVGYGVWHSQSNTPVLAAPGYILTGEAGQAKQLSFAGGSTYSATFSSEIKVDNAGGMDHLVPVESFAHMENGGTMAFSDGILLNFADLTDNFVNNYYIRSGLTISESGDGYVAEAASGTMQFGEFLWKLSDRAYIIQASDLKVCLGNEADVWDTKDFVQVNVSEDGIVYLMTQENLWMTISAGAYIETANGVRVYPVTQIVDDGVSKLSLAKLPVSQEDAIVLTEDETRRQIVPELNIVGVDGEDGLSGQAGQSGDAGTAGAAGSAGAAGTAGENGTDGKAGEEGADGSAGLNGAGGAGGTTGTTGGQGGAGTNGSNGAAAPDGQGGKDGVGGEDGTDGINGEKGDDGEKGGQGSQGGQGVQGATGNGGATGNNAQVDSSTNTALPTMTFTNWQVTAKSLAGTIYITDQSQMLQALSGKELQYPGKVTITNLKTGEQIPCYEATYHTDTNSYSVLKEEDETGFGGFYVGHEAQVHFSTMNAPLEPDTQYRITVTCYYTTTDDVGLVYSREFINRSFYTDSTGVHLSYVSAKEASVTIKASLSDAFKDSLRKVKVYLLTPEQNKTFTASSSDYIDMKELSAADLGSGSVNMTFLGSNGKVLEHNKKYVARVIVETDDMEALTKQELEVMTLKTPLTKQEADAKPTVNYNRMTGGFEVYRPVVSDPDGGVVTYTYTAYRLEGGEHIEESTRIVTPTAGEPVVFRLASNVDYIFGVKAEFHDNEKSVIYDLGNSDPVRAMGDTMPSISLDITDQGKDYDRLSGTLSISLGEKSSVEITEFKPLTVELFADQLETTFKVELKNLNTPVNVNGKDSSNGTVSLATFTNNRVDLQLDLKGLYKNSNYSIAVSGWLNVGDGNPAQLRAIGTVTFQTYNTLPLVVAWTEASTTEAGTAALSQKLRISVQQDVDGNIPGYAYRKAYAENRLTGGSSASSDPCGQVTVILYRGSGPTKLQIAQANFTNKADLEAIFNGGLVVTEEHFGNPRIEVDSPYTLTVTAVADSSYMNLDQSTVNYYEELINPSRITSGVTQPPDLLRDPTTGVRVKPIYNEDIGNFSDQTKDEDLPDDAIVGFTLEATYDNVQRLGTSVTYYAYELNALSNAIDAFNIKEALIDTTPLKEMSPLMTMTQPISNSSDEVPKVAILFGGTKTTDESAKYHNGYMVYWSGTAQFDGTLKEGMSRGFRYVFGYEVDYTVSVGSGENIDTVTRTYPYSHSDYNDFQNLYGGLDTGFTEFGKAYILNSGVCDAPLILPDFHVYVASSIQGTPVQTGVVATATGTVTLHYTWRDSEGMANSTNAMVITSGDDSMLTKITFPSDVPGVMASQTVGQPEHQVPGAADWYTVSIPYSHTANQLALLEPTVNVKAYRIDYSPCVGDEVDEPAMPLGPFPVDWSWQAQFAGAEYTNGIHLKQDPHFNENYIDFILQGQYAFDLASRAVAVELTFQITGDSTSVKSFVLPLTIGNDGNPRARVMTGQLGTPYLHKEYTVSGARLIYDTGAQGWDLATFDSGESAKNFAVQYTVASQDTPGWGEYAFATSGSGISSSGSYLYYNEPNLTGALRGSIHPTDNKQDVKVSFLVRSRLPNRGTNLYYLYPTLTGVDTNSTSNIEILSGKTMVPKGLATFNLKFHTGAATDTGVLTNLTPTVAYTNMYITTQEVSFGGMTIEGMDGAGDIYLALFEEKENAEALTPGKAVKEVKVSIGSDGRPGSSTVLDKLQSNKTYFLAIYYYNSDNEKVLLLDRSTAKPAVYQLTTSDSVTIRINDLEYLNESYFDKWLVADFYISQVLRIDLKYDIFSSQEEAEKEQPGDVLTYDQMVATNLLTEPTGLNHNDNKLTMELDPKAARDALDPGVTYYFKISAYEDEEMVGYTVQEFKLDPIGSFGALAYVPDASDKSISFVVTITDPEYALMGKTRDEGALYAVRFTDAAGNRIYTDFDSQLYPAFGLNTLQRSFQLNDNNLVQGRDQSIQANTQYQLHVFAVPDVDHNGSVTLGGTTYTHAELFGAGANGQNTRFHDLLESFWDVQGRNNPAMDAVENQLRIAQKLQSTTTEDNWLLNTERVYTVKTGTNNVRIVFAESMGLIKPNGDPVFGRIDWYLSGTSQTGAPIIAEGTSRRSENAPLLVKGKDAGYDVYYFDIPYSLPSGTYTFVIQLRQTEDQTAADKTITLVSGIS